MTENSESFDIDNASDAEVLEKLIKIKAHIEKDITLLNSEISLCLNTLGEAYIKLKGARTLLLECEEHIANMEKRIANEKD